MFNDSTSFDNSTFGSDAIFNESRFNGKAFFQTAFKGNASFISAKFHNGTIFYNSRFDRDANFADSRFDGNVAFPRTAFNGNANFIGIRFNDEADFEETKFNSSLILFRTRYDKLYIKWDNISKLEYDPTSYQLLIENFRKLGFNKDADNSYHQFRVDQFTHWETPHGSFVERIQDFSAHLFDGVALISYGYGKKPSYPFFGSIITILLFSMIWKIGGLNRTRAMIFSATVFLSGTKLFVDPPRRPETFWCSAAFRIERVSGAFFSILFFLAIASTK